jgi:Bax protein
VRSYIWNLNTHRAYAGFRKVRSAQRGGQQGLITLDSKKLADTLTSYSERGTEYTEELKSTISYNRLDRADHLRLIEGEPVYFN